jgi:peptide/nickel transport system permease protein
MTRYIFKRIVYGLIVLFGLTIFSFVLIHLVPGDPARLMLGENANQEQVNALRDQLGLNKPLLTQYLDYLSKLCRFDYGNSYKTGRPVLTEILLRLPNTIELASAGMLIAIIVGITTGILAAKYKDRIIDWAAMSLSIFGLSIPSFWLGIMLILIFSVKLGWFPVANGTGLKELILPAITLGVLASTVISRITRSVMIEVLSSDYIRTAKAKGLNEWRILIIHAFRNAMIPVVTIVGLQIASLLGGTVIIEQVFSWPGLGSLAINSILARDFPMVQGIVLFIGIIFVTINILVDLLYGLIDPRIRVTNQ